MALDHQERLLENESLTDFCHMHLRTRAGLSEVALRNKFSERTLAHTWPRLNELHAQGLLQTKNGAWSLTDRGTLISNKVFEKLTFLQDELKLGGLTA